jgi:hypothetical protein
MSDAQEMAARHVALIALATVVVVAVPIGLVKGAPAVVLGLAFALLSGAVLLFWETLRLVLDPAQPGDADDGDDDGAALADLDARKRAALQALRDLEFERSIGRIGEEDHKALEARYREEARAAMRAIDEGIGPWRARAEAMLAAAAGGAEATDTETAVDVPAEASTGPVTVGVDCPKCATANDDDAVFCKRCGERLKPEAADATT